MHVKLHVHVYATHEHEHLQWLYPFALPCFQVDLFTCMFNTSTVCQHLVLKLYRKMMTHVHVHVYKCPVLEVHVQLYMYMYM